MSGRDTVADVKARLLDAEDEHSEGVMAAILNHLLRLHAHELAEQIREAARGSYPSGLCPVVSTAKGAADLIDPDVQTPAYVMTDIARSRVAWNVAAPIDEEDTP